MHPNFIQMSSINTPTKYADAILDATRIILESHPESFLLGLGISQSGMSKGLKDRFPKQVIDTPTSEASLTGLAVGAAISGLKPIVHHERVEFCLVAADQIFTQAAKWNYMFGGNNPVPLTLRIAVGRQWGNGPQHTQALYSLFGNVTGIKVVIPSTPYMAKGLLISAVEENCPVIFLEPRWLYSTTQVIPDNYYKIPLESSLIHKEGADATIVTYGDGILTAIQAQELIKDDVDLEIIDLVSINPIDFSTIYKSLVKTKRLITIDTTNDSFNVGSEIISKVAIQMGQNLVAAPLKISCPNVPCPTATSLTEHFYPTKLSVANEILNFLKLPSRLEINLSFEELHHSPTFAFSPANHDGAKS